MEFWKSLRDSFNTKASNQEKTEAEKLLKKYYYYEFFISRIGAAPFRGYGSSVKKGSTTKEMMEWLIEFMVVVLKKMKIRMIVALESVLYYQNKYVNNKFNFIDKNKGIMY